MENGCGALGSAVAGGDRVDESRPRATTSPRLRRLLHEQNKEVPLIRGGLLHEQPVYDCIYIKLYALLFST